MSKEELAVRLLLSVSNAVSSSSLSSIRAFGRLAISMGYCKLRIQHRLRNRLAIVPLIFGRVVLFKSTFGNGEDVNGIDGGAGVTGVDDVLDSTVDMATSMSGS